MRYPSIYIVCHKLDYFLAQIAVASIRYYYPDVEINLVKDEINGKFSTTELEQQFSVNLISLGEKRFGWASAKIFLLLSSKLKGKKILVLDADTVFVGNVLDKIVPYLERCDFIISPEYNDKPGSKTFTDFYYDFALFRLYYPNLTFPGFTFNTGNIVITAGLLKKRDVKKYFNTSKYPYWTAFGQKMLPTRDQSLLNILLPLKVKLKQLKWKQLRFMLWFGEDTVKQLLITDIKAGTNSFLIHWAGEKRIPFLPAMKRGDILLFFQKYYFTQLPFGKMRFYLNLLLEGLKYYLYFYPRELLGIDKIPTWMADDP